MFMFLLALVFNTSLAADDAPAGQKVFYNPKTEIDFEELEIEGILQKPQSSIVIERKKANFNPLIKLRSNWNDEISESIEEIK